MVTSASYFNCLIAKIEIALSAMPISQHLSFIFLYREWLIADRDSEHSADLEDQLVSVLHRSLGRWLGACSNASAQFCGWPETAQKENEDYVN